MNLSAFHVYVSREFDGRAFSYVVRVNHGVRPVFVFYTGNYEEALEMGPCLIEFLGFNREIISTFIDETEEF